MSELFENRIFLNRPQTELEKPLHKQYEKNNVDKMNVEKYDNEIKNLIVGLGSIVND